MNQILDYSPNKTSKKGGSSGSDKIVRVFAILLAIFAICLLGVGGYSILKNRKAMSDADSGSVTQATVAVIQNDEYFC